MGLCSHVRSERVVMAAAPEAALPDAPPKIRHEWYQTDSTVIVTVLVKGMRKECVKVESTERQVIQIKNDTVTSQSCAFTALNCVLRFSVLTSHLPQ